MKRLLIALVCFLLLLMSADLAKAVRVARVSVRAGQSRREVLQ